MPQIPIIMPQLGESIAEATIVNFLVQPGDTVKGDQDIIEVETNKATMNVASPCAGTIAEVHACKPARAIRSARCSATSKPARRKRSALGLDTVQPVRQRRRA